MSEKVEVIITGDNKASPAINGVAASLGSLKGSTSLVTAAFKQLAPYLAGTAIIAGMKSLISAAAEDELMFKRLETSINLMGGSFDKSKGRIDDFISMMRSTTQFGDDDLIPVLQEITQMTGSLEKGFWGANIAANMAASGLYSLEEAGRLIAMAMEGNTMLLGRQIFALKDQQMELAGAKTAAEKSAYAIQYLNEHFGTSAAENVDTYSGRLKQLSVTFSEIGENLGNIALPALTKWSTKLNETLILIENMQNKKGGALTKQDVIPESLTARLALIKWYESELKTLEASSTALNNKILNPPISVKLDTALFGWLLPYEKSHGYKKWVADLADFQIKIADYKYQIDLLKTYTQPAGKDPFTFIAPSVEVIERWEKLPAIIGNVSDKLRGVNAELLTYKINFQDTFPEYMFEPGFVGAPEAEWADEYNSLGHAAGEDFSISFKDATQAGLQASFSTALQPIFNQMGGNFGRSFAGAFLQAFISALMAQLAAELALALFSGGKAVLPVPTLSMGRSGITSVRSGAGSIEAVRSGLNDLSRQRRDYL